MAFVSHEEIDDLKRLVLEQSKLLESLSEAVQSLKTDVSAIRHNTEPLPSTTDVEAMFKNQERWLYDEMERHERLSANRDEKVLVYIRETAKCAMGHSSHEIAERQVFSEAPSAKGNLRLYQLANAKLMSKLDKILDHLGIDYWFACGTLLASYYRNASIPWDDDIDIYLMREDVDKLISYLDNVSEGDLGFGYQVSVAYDRIAMCKQVRFSKAGDLPCFIDLSLMDWTCAYDDDQDQILHNLREKLMAEIEVCDDLQYWHEHPFLYADPTKQCVQVIDDDQDNVDQTLATNTIQVIEEIFKCYRKLAQDAGILVDISTAQGVAQGLDQVYDQPTRRFIWDKKMIFPTKKNKYEGYQFNIPHQADEVCQGCYPGSPYIPDDIAGHDHFSKRLLDDPKTVNVLKAFLNEK